MHYCQRDSHATSHTVIYANITQTGRITNYLGYIVAGFGLFCWFCGWFWLVLAGLVGGFGRFRVLVTTMYTSFFKREPRTNSTLPIHQISKSISENKHGGRNTGKRVCIPRSLSVSRELTVPCQYTEFQKQSNNQ